MTLKINQQRNKMMDGFERKFCLKGGWLCFLGDGIKSISKTLVSLRFLNRFTSLASRLKQVVRKTSSYIDSYPQVTRVKSGSITNTGESQDSISSTVVGAH